MNIFDMRIRVVQDSGLLDQSLIWLVSKDVKEVGCQGAD
jgi:hypothetical protein